LLLFGCSKGLVKGTRTVEIVPKHGRDRIIVVGIEGAEIDDRRARVALEELLGVRGEVLAGEATPRDAHIDPQQTAQKKITRKETKLHRFGRNQEAASHSARDQGET
jgi:hypothetical protein